MLAIAQKLLRRVESSAQWWQGKGYGAASLSAEIKAAARFIPVRGATILDVGANKGLWTRELLRQIPGLSAVYAFEPSAHNWTSVEQIDDSRLRLIKAAVSDHDGEATLFSDEPGSSWASLTRRNIEFMGVRFDHSETIRTLTLDTFIEREGLHTIDFAKFDIEGHELAAFRGAEKALQNKTIRALAFEFGGCNIDTRTYFRDFWYLLRGCGYNIYRIAPPGQAMLIPAYLETLECFLATNYLAVDANERLERAR